MLKHAFNLLWQLRVTTNKEDHYFQLCKLFPDRSILSLTDNAVIAEIKKLDNYFESSDFRLKNHFLELYETVQHAGNAVPRFYLSVLVAKNLIAAPSGPSVSLSTILNDICSMAKIIQHPLRGLYARYFMVETLAVVLDNLELTVPHSAPPERTAQYDDLPAGQSPVSCPVADAHETKSLTTTKSVLLNFFMTNIADCNKLLTRLGYLAGGGHIGRQVRDDHAFLLQTPIRRLANIRLITPQFFAEFVNPKYLNFVASLRDRQSQNLLYRALLIGKW